MITKLEIIDKESAIRVLEDPSLMASLDKEQRKALLAVLEKWKEEL